ncbi:TPA: hypothetical protein ACOEC0_001141 [Stenotrophomonas maltophilia]
MITEKHLTKNEIRLAKSLVSSLNNIAALRWHVRIAHDMFPGRVYEICMRALNILIRSGSSNLLVLIDAMIDVGERLPPHPTWLICKEAFLSGEIGSDAIAVMERILQQGVDEHEIESTLNVALAVQCEPVVALLTDHLHRKRVALANRISKELNPPHTSVGQSRKM